jgi:hypothetical protein
MLIFQNKLISHQLLWRQIGLHVMPLRGAMKCSATRRPIFSGELCAGQSSAAPDLRHAKILTQAAAFRPHAHSLKSGILPSEKRSPDFDIECSDKIISPKCFCHNGFYKAKWFYF